MIKDEVVAYSCFCLDRTQETRGKNQVVSLKAGFPLRYVTSIVQIYRILSILILE
jgi:hypothetical protein